MEELDWVWQYLKRLLMYTVEKYGAHNNKDEKGPSFFSLPLMSEDDY